MWLADDTGLITPVATCDIPEAYNAPRQILPKVFLQNACIDVVRSKVVLNKHSMSGNRIGGFVQRLDFDIDTEEEFTRAEVFIEASEKLRRGENLTVCVDIDGILAEKTIHNDYTAAKPIASNIEVINYLFDRGCTIIIFTARGSKTGTDWRKVTQEQLAAWGVRHSVLQFGKPAADYYIDDRSASVMKARELLDE
jgi:hypothetical protein